MRLAPRVIEKSRRYAVNGPAHPMPCTRTRTVHPTRTAHCGYLSGVLAEALGRPEKAMAGEMDTSVLSGEEAALAGLYAARRGM